MTAEAPAKPQYMRALDRANEVRLARADRKRWITAGKDRHLALVRALAVLGDIPWEMETCPVSVFLEALPRVGSSVMRQITREALLPEKKHLGAMTDRQRHQLAGELSRRFGA
jgi:hypothetical protein